MNGARNILFRGISEIHEESRSIGKFTAPTVTCSSEFQRTTQGMTGTALAVWRFKLPVTLEVPGNCPTSYHLLSTVYHLQWAKRVSAGCKYVEFRG